MVGVVILFLQTWRAAIIPVVAIPISLVGCFLIMGVLGLSFNTLSLFGLVLAIGIVVDDAIVVVENVERYIEKGMARERRRIATMDEVGGALIAIALVLCAVFIPTAFIIGTARRRSTGSSRSPSPRNGDFRVCLADAVSGAGRAAAEAARGRAETSRCRIGSRRPCAVFCRVQLGIRAAVRWAMARLVARLVRVGVIVAGRRMRG